MGVSSGTGGAGLGHGRDSPGRADVLKPEFGLYVDLEAGASTLHTYDVELVHGLAAAPRLRPRRHADAEPHRREYRRLWGLLVGRSIPLEEFRG